MGKCDRGQAIVENQKSLRFKNGFKKSSIPLQFDTLYTLTVDFIDGLHIKFNKQFCIRHLRCTDF